MNSRCLRSFRRMVPRGEKKVKERENIQVGEHSFALYRERFFDKETADHGSRC